MHYTMTNQQESVSTDQIATILEEAIAEILSHEVSDRFLRWMRGEAQRFFGNLHFADAGGPPAMAGA